MGVLKVKLPNGVWENISGVTTNEVVTSATDPRQGLYSNAQIWIDTSTNPPLVKFWSTQMNPAGWATLSTIDLPLAGGTMTGNITFGGTNLGVNFNGGSRVYAHTDKPLTLLEGTSNAQPQIRNNDGSNARDIVDTQTVLSGTNYNFALQTGWSSAGFSTSIQQFRVNAATVTVTSHELKGPAVGGNAASRITTYPTGVPAPWAKQSTTAFVNRPSYADGEQFTLVEARGDGIYCVNSFPGGDWMLNFSMTWSR